MEGRRRVGVIGAGGRMGRAVSAAVAAADDLELCAAITRRPREPTIAGVTVTTDFDALTAAGAEVVVDFTAASAARSTLPWLAARGLHAVVGTTGFSDDDFDAFRAQFTRSNCIIAANFAISAVLMMRFAELAAPWFETAEIIEYHHDAKIDAPSGTAMETTRRMSAASAEWAGDATRAVAFPGSRGPGGIHVHAVRLRGLEAHQEAILGTAGQTLTIRQDSYDRAGYLPGVLTACRRVRDPGRP